MSEINLEPELSKLIEDIINIDQTKPTTEIKETIKNLVHVFSNKIHLKNINTIFRLTKLNKIYKKQIREMQLALEKKNNYLFEAAEINRRRLNSIENYGADIARYREENITLREKMLEYKHKYYAELKINNRYDNLS